MKGAWLLLRSHAAVAFLVSVSATTLGGYLLGPGPRFVIVRDGALGNALPFVLALCGVAAAVCLVEPAPSSWRRCRGARGTRGP